MKYTVIKVDNIDEAVEKLNGLEQFKALGLPYPASKYSNWEDGVPDENYPEFILDIPNYTEEELKEDVQVQLRAMFGAVQLGIPCESGDAVILVDLEDEDELNAILVVNAKEKNIFGVRGDGKGGRMVTFDREGGDTDLINEAIAEIKEDNPEFAEYTNLLA